MGGTTVEDCLLSIYEIKKDTYVERYYKQKCRESELSIVLKDCGILLI